MRRTWLPLALICAMAVGCEGKTDPPQADAETRKKEQEQTEKMMKESGEQRLNAPAKK